MRVLVTGGTGFVGLAAAEALLKRKADVVVVDHNPVPEAQRWLPGAAILQGDVRDGAALTAIARQHNVDVILHAAAVTSGSSAAELTQLFTVNVLGTVAVCDAALQMPSVRRVVLVSSGATVEGIVTGVINDPAALAPVSSYGASKIAAELAARELLSDSGIDLRIARLGPIFGPFERSTSVRTRTSAVHALVLRAFSALPSRIWEDQGGDWLYSRDAGDALGNLVLAEAALASDVFFMSGERITTLSEVAEALAVLIPNWRADIGQTPNDADVVSSFARAPFDSSAARNELGLNSRPLDEALSDYLDWLRAEQHAAIASNITRVDL